MAAYTTTAHANDPAIATRSASAGTVAVNCGQGDLAVDAATGTEQRRAPGGFEGVRAAASVMGWVLWIFLALVTAAFLAFAPCML